MTVVFAVALFAVTEGGKVAAVGAGGGILGLLLYLLQNARTK